MHSPKPMDRTKLSTRGALITAVAAIAILTAAPPADAQRPEVDLDLLVELPLATALAVDAGVPADEVAGLAGSLLEARLAPRDFLEVMALAPSIYLPREGRTRYPGRDDRTPGMGSFVQAQLDRGLRGRELAASIHDELRRRGVPAGPKDRSVAVRGGDLVIVGTARPRSDRDRVRGLREGRLPRVEPKARGERLGGPPPHAGPAAGPPADRSRGQGRAEAGKEKGGPPPGAGKGRGRGQAKPDERGGPPPAKPPASRVGGGAR